jgi:hypothetical protein
MGMPPPAARSGRGPLFWITVGCGGCLTMVVLFVALIAGGAYFMTKGPVDAIQAQLAEMRQGDLDEAYGRLSEAYRARVSRREFERMVKEQVTLRDNAEGRFLFPSGSVKVENDRARVSGTLLAASGEREKAEYELLREDGEWRIAAIRIGGAELLPPPPTPAPAAVRPLEVSTLLVRKEPLESGIKVTLKVRVTGFEVRLQGDRYALDLAEDLETFAPDGSRIDSLSRPNFKTLQDTTPAREGNYADFETTLTMPRALNGEYRVRLIIRDRIGGTAMPHDVTFAIP